MYYYEFFSVCNKMLVYTSFNNQDISIFKNEKSTRPQVPRLNKIQTIDIADRFKTPKSMQKIV